jgi:hypothetical protein
MALSKRQWAGIYGAVQWGGETCVGLIPLLAFAMMHKYAGLETALRDEILRCTKGIVYTSQCNAVLESVFQEMCILTVVIAGLAALSVCSIGPNRRKSENTVLTYILLVICILALLAGMLLYALFGAHIAQGADEVTAWVLTAALVASLFLSLEGAILDA